MDFPSNEEFMKAMEACKKTDNKEVKEEVKEAVKEEVKEAVKEISDDDFSDMDFPTDDQLNKAIELSRKSAKRQFGSTVSLTSSEELKSKSGGSESNEADRLEQLELIKDLNEEQNYSETTIGSSEPNVVSFKDVKVFEFKNGKVELLGEGELKFYDNDNDKKKRVTVDFMRDQQDTKSWAVSSSNLKPMQGRVDGFVWKAYELPDESVVVVLLTVFSNPIDVERFTEMFRVRAIAQGLTD